jgi:transcriptional regulator GlxA family with amidase domain
MPASSTSALNVLVIALPNFNLAATAGFVDPFRAANYLEGQSHLRWEIASLTGGATRASNGVTIETWPLGSISIDQYHLIMVSSSWTPEAHGSPLLRSVLRRGSRRGVTLGGLDTGAFVLARFGLLEGRRATVHYEHLEAFKELYPEVNASDHLFVIDGDRISCSGGEAAADLSLHLIARTRGESLANRAARYLFHERLRPVGARQNASTIEPMGSTVPQPVRKAIQAMEEHLEAVVPIPKICQLIGTSRRQLDRLFAQFVRQSPARYYRDIRLDRARGLVTQTELSMSEVAVASGFTSQVHFSRAYRARFGIVPVRDRIQGRIPFEFRARPLHQPARATPLRRAGLSRNVKK